MTTFTTQSTVASVLNTVGSLIDGYRVRRAQRLALVALMEMDPSRLDDLGISIEDVRDAVTGTLPAGPRLEARRTARALNWTPNAVSAA
ncbi:hypothetical protein [Devosia nitrariae]|uniref:DUF1127 domain-containing protein n=1 Tax=Devosia nitrariae TaxID=2071872 RepID=A0ABQ5W2L0_9HYPH|nr:hypothetical protein [Devosia nitrariae]GLQ54268.1 hypothetical protein GCM10010862_15270 [Devosia nitrariae]